jgi:hypothetical protein
MAHITGLAHPGRDPDDALRGLLVVLAAARFAEALRESPETTGQNDGREKLARMCEPVDAAVRRLAERLRRNDAQRNAICARIGVLSTLGEGKARWTGAMYAYGLHKELSAAVIRMCQAAEIGVAPEFYQRNLPLAVRRSIEWLRERL